MIFQGELNLDFGRKITEDDEEDNLSFVSDFDDEDNLEETKDEKPSLSKACPSSEPLTPTKNGVIHDMQVRQSEEKKKNRFENELKQGNQLDKMIKRKLTAIEANELKIQTPESQATMNFVLK